MTIPGPLRRLLHFASVDRAVGYTLLGRVVALLSAPLTVFFQIWYLTGEQRGYLYTFDGLLGFVALVELGIGPAIGIFTSHEMAVLRWGTRDELIGPPAAMARLQSLQRLGLAWFAVMVLVTLVGVLPFGFWFFEYHEAGAEPVSWRLAWLLSALCMSGTLIVAPLFAVLEGAGMVSEMAIMRLRAIVIANLTTWSTLALGGALLAAPVLSGTALLVSVVHLWMWRRRVLSVGAGHPEGGRVAYWKEIWPLQWRIGLSWISGYFVNYLISPIVFAVHGKAAAGQYGMSMRLGNSLQNISLSWVTAHGPTLTGLVARREWAPLDQVFFRRLKMTLAIMALGIASVWLLICAFKVLELGVAEAFVPPIALAMLLASAWAATLIASLGMYIRFHKTDPLYIYNVAQGLLLLPLVFVLGKFFGITGVAATTLATTLGLLACVLAVFRHTRRGHTETR